MNRAYVRVSTVEQNEARQLEALRKHDIDEWYTEKVSGKDTNRPELQRLLGDVQSGDTVYILDFSRLARSTKDLLDIVDKMQELDVHLVSLKENLDTSTPTGRLMLTMIAAINEFERANTLERQREGITIAKRNGVYKERCGRKKISMDISATMNAVAKGIITKVEAARELGVSRQTLYRMMREGGECV